MPVIGYLGSRSPGRDAPDVRAFAQGLGESGFVEGRNVAIEYHWAEGQYDRLPAMATDLVRRKVAVIFAIPGLSALAAKAATTTIPIVFISGIDPVDYGLVPSLSRPSGNLTGVSSLSVELTAKRLELLHELVPTATTIAHLVNPANPADNGTPTLKTVQVAARSLGLRLLVLEMTSERDVEPVFASLLQNQAGALLMSSDPFVGSMSEKIAALTVRHAVPAMFVDRLGVAAGGLVSFGAKTGEASHLAGIYAARILKGEKPADLPVQQSTKVELIINLKAAKALGITVPVTLLGRADEVIE
jgi:putative tryptophan/tyrosine transport system substrate-binding protein